MSDARHPYARASYAEALAAGSGGRTVDAPAWSCALVARPIAGGLEDAAGPYPRAPLPAAADLGGGLAQLAAAGFVSVVLVADPLAAPPPERLASAFPFVRPFKTHYLVDHARGAPALSRHHRYEVRRALGRCRVEAVRLVDHLDDWNSLYEGLKTRHGVTGPAAFSDAYFRHLAAAPEYEALAAICEERIVAMAIWFEHDGVALNHLGASDEAGYAVGASYALYAAALDRYAGAAVLDLGGAAGMGGDANDGLARFKRGFANAEVVAHLCGSVLDAGRYAALTAGRPPTAFFPAYRAAGLSASLTAAATRAMSEPS